jgi:hypothetical protein
MKTLAEQVETAVKTGYLKTTDRSSMQFYLAEAEQLAK